MRFEHHDMTMLKLDSTHSLLSHLVIGHSHIPLKSDLLLSDFMYSSGDKPGRSSHSGLNPASGAVRTGTPGDSTVACRRVATDICLLGANAAAVERIAAATKSFILTCCYRYCKSILMCDKRKDPEDLLSFVDIEYRLGNFFRSDWFGGCCGNLWYG